MAVDVEPDLRHATVHYATLIDPSAERVAGVRTGMDAIGPPGPDADAVVLAAFAEVRPRLQAAVARQARMKRTPELAFRPDTVERSAARVEEVLRDLHRDEPPSAT